MVRQIFRRKTKSSYALLLVLLIACVSVAAIKTAPAANRSTAEVTMERISSSDAWQQPPDPETASERQWYERRDRAADQATLQRAEWAMRNATQ